MQTKKPVKRPSSSDGGFQIDKFREAARELETDDDEKRFDAMLRAYREGGAEGRGGAKRQADLLTLFALNQLGAARLIGKCRDSELGE